MRWVTSCLVLCETSGGPTLQGYIHRWQCDIGRRSNVSPAWVGLAVRPIRHRFRRSELELRGPKQGLPFSTQRSRVV
eukprot:7241572-Alexandrium_andersonii.AAC.1